jgi:hypothetical protein
VDGNQEHETPQDKTDEAGDRNAGESVVGSRTAA